jgi:hypothetical protein
MAVWLLSPVLNNIKQKSPEVQHAQLCLCLEQVRGLTRDTRGETPAVNTRNVNYQELIVLMKHLKEAVENLSQSSPELAYKVVQAWVACAKASQLIAPPPRILQNTLKTTIFGTSTVLKKRKRLAFKTRASVSDMREASRTWFVAKEARPPVPVKGGLEASLATDADLTRHTLPSQESERTTLLRRVT